MNGQNTKNPKSALTAGVLALILGAFGTHNWYLNDRKKARTHVILAIVTASAFVLGTILKVSISSVGSLGIANFMASSATVCRIIGWFALVIDAVWAIIEGILLLIQGDDGLAEKGYTIAQSSADAVVQEATPSSNVIATSGTTQSPAEPLQAPPTISTPSPQPPVVTPNQPAPITYHSSNIQQSSQPQLLSQAVSSSDVETAALTVKDSTGKSKINPVILRKVLLATGAIIAVVIGGFAVKWSIDSAFAVGYGDAYRLARQISPNLTTAAQSSSCQYAVDYLTSAYVNKKTYDGYIDVCRSLATEDTSLVSQLGDTGAIKWDTGISTQYKEFQELYDGIFANAERAEKMVQALNLYQIWHNYILATDTLAVDSPDQDFQNAADILRQSGNDTLAKYGDEWYYKQIDYLNSYRAYWNLSYTDPNKEAAKLEADTKRADLQAWVADHRPNVRTLAPFDVPNLTPVYESFTKLYNLIRTGYEQHYDRKSGDCREAGSKVYCS